MTWQNVVEFSFPRPVQFLAFLSRKTKNENRIYVKISRLKRKDGNAFSDCCLGSSLVSVQKLQNEPRNIAILLLYHCIV